MHRTLVTGAGGFIGRHVVKRLSDTAAHVRAGFHREPDPGLFAGLSNVECVRADMLDRASLLAAMEGVDAVFHLAAMVDSHASLAKLMRSNVDGARNVWGCAAEAGVRRALYCSSAAVYGLLGRSSAPAAEDTPARAIEAYGFTKRQGEEAVLSVSRSAGLHTIVIRPVAVFGPGEHTPFGDLLRSAAMSKLLIAGRFREGAFNYVQVEDVAQAAVHLMNRQVSSGAIYNVTVPTAIRYKHAFDAYQRMLAQLGSRYGRARRLARVSSLLHGSPGLLRLASRMFGDGRMFTVWRPGFDMLYSGAKLAALPFACEWTDFESVLRSCLEPEASWP